MKKMRLFTTSISVILLLLFFHNPVKGQKAFKVTFYPDSFSINGIKYMSDTIISSVKVGSLNRIIIWEEGNNKVSILSKIKNRNNKIIEKSRIEIFRNGKWEKPKLKFGNEGFRIFISRWPYKSKIHKNLFKNKYIPSSKSGFPIEKYFIGTEDEEIYVRGYFEFIHK